MWRIIGDWEKARREKDHGKWSVAEKKEPFGRLLFVFPRCDVDGALLFSFIDGLVKHVEHYR